MGLHIFYNVHEWSIFRVQRGFVPWIPERLWQENFVIFKVALRGDVLF